MPNTYEYDIFLSHNKKRQACDCGLMRRAEQCLAKKLTILSKNILVRYEYENADVGELFINNGDE